MQREEHPGMSTGFERRVAKARQEPKLHFTSLAHHIDVERLWHNLCHVPRYTSYKVANMVLEFATSIPRTQLRPSYGDGLLGAPLQSRPPRESPAPREQGDQRGSSSTQRQ